jgi:PAS domain S-box-containing protein
VAVSLALVTQTQIFTELLRKTKDSIIQTDLRGTIAAANPATEVLLGYAEPEMIGTMLSKYFKDNVEAQQVQDSEYVSNDEVCLVRKDGAEIIVLLNGTSLPHEIGMKVYVCSDLSFRKQMASLEILRQMYNEIASQIKTPLSLAFTWLGKLSRSELPAGVRELLDSSIKQLNKVDLTFDRLLFYEREKGIAPASRSLFDVAVVIEKIRQEMPVSEAAEIEVTTDPNTPPVSGDIFQIWFCLESLLAYFVRFITEEEKVSVNISSGGGQVITIVRGHAPQVSAGTISRYADERWAIRAITEMALGEQMIRSFVEQNHGVFDKRRDGDLMEYVVALPAA